MSMGSQNEMNESNQGDRTTTGATEISATSIEGRAAAGGRATARVAPTIPAAGETASSRGDPCDRPENDAHSENGTPLGSPSLWSLGRPFAWLFYLCVFEMGYLLLFALSSLPGLHLYDTPIAVAWSWTLFPSHLLLALFGP